MSHRPGFPLKGSRLPAFSGAGHGWQADQRRSGEGPAEINRGKVAEWRKFYEITGQGTESGARATLA